VKMQIKASYKKEILAYFRTGRAIVIALVLLGLAVISPLFITGLSALMDSMSEIYDEFGIDVSEMTEVLVSASSTGVSSSVSDITGAGLIVLLLLLNRTAGGEQKKRTVIIPRSAGLSSLAYIYPKFIIYPLYSFILAFVGLFASWGVSVLLFDYNDVTFYGVLIAGVLTGVCLMMYVCFHLTLGTATGKAGMSAAVCIAASILLSNVFAFTDMDYMFNPFALGLLAASVVHNSAITSRELLDIAVTIVFALGIMLLSYWIALFAQNARRIDNSGNEIDL